MSYQAHALRITIAFIRLLHDSVNLVSAAKRFANIGLLANPNSKNVFPNISSPTEGDRSSQKDGAKNGDSRKVFFLYGVLYEYVSNLMQTWT